MRFNIFSMNMDLLPMAGAVDKISCWLDGPAHCHYVVTPNVDHVIAIRNNARLRESYSQASMCVIDGWPVALITSIAAKKKVDVIPGSDLVPALFSHLNNLSSRRARVFLMGAAPGVASEAARKISLKWPNIEICGVYSPPFGFEHDLQESEKICRLVNQAQTELLILGLGTPKQEVWINQYRSKIVAKAAVCAGATIDFFAGRQRRAPVMVRRAKLEWAYRALREPRRLMFRYIKGLLLFPLIAARELLTSKKY